MKKGLTRSNALSYCVCIARQTAKRNLNQTKEKQMNKTYKIIRFRFNGNNKVLKTGLTLEQAQAHCNDAKSAGNGWFDGYNVES